MQEAAEDESADADANEAKQHDNPNQRNEGSSECVGGKQPNARGDEIADESDDSKEHDVPSFLSECPFASSMFSPIGVIRS